MNLRIGLFQTNRGQ